MDEKALPAVEPTLTAPPAADDNTVDFTIGGHAFRVPIPTLWDAKQSGKHLPPGLIANAEQAIDLVLNSSEDAAGLAKETLMRGCSLGEAIRLAESLKTLFERAGVPMVQAPATAPAAPPAMPMAPPLSQTVELSVARSPNFPAPSP